MSTRRRVAVLTTARSEYGIYRPLLRAIRNESALELQLIVAASHLDPRFGTVTEIESDGYVPAARVQATLEGDGPLAIARVMGEITSGMAAAFDRLKPDIIVALGDRSEMEAAVAAAIPFLIPVVHIAGGAITRGAIDDGFRHAISKLSHIHFPETEAQKERLLRLGEEGWRIHVTGSLSIDNVRALTPLSLEEITALFGIALSEPPLMVTLHPETRDFSNSAANADTLLAALEAQEVPIVFTYPGADVGGRTIIERIEEFVRRNSQRTFAVPHMGTEAYFSLMGLARAMVGNSSSGILEAASFELPVVNIGRRQEGRFAPANVITCDFGTTEIQSAIAQALSPSFRTSLKGLVNPYGCGNAAAQMVAVLKNVALDKNLLLKAAF